MRSSASGSIFCPRSPSCHSWSHKVSFSPYDVQVDGRHALTLSRIRLPASTRRLARSLSPQTRWSSSCAPAASASFRRVFSRRSSTSNSSKSTPFELPFQSSSHRLSAPVGVALPPSLRLLWVRRLRLRSLRSLRKHLAWKT
jgi:hypothetical protein